MNALQRQGLDHWWSVDGDYLLGAMMPFPCPGDEIAAALRRLDRPLFGFDKDRNPEARGG